jgi:magnesium-protoporphyrin IX monomethyl ester (oxidative) cyclase
MKVLLVNPPSVIFKNEAKSCHPPLGLAYLAAVLKNEYEVCVLDCVAEGFENEERFGSYVRYGYSYENIRKRIIKIKPDAIGVSCLFSSVIGEARNICKIAKEIDSGIKTILGGIHPTVMPRETLKDKNVDFVIAGEGEYALKELLKNINTGNGRFLVKGVFSRENIGDESAQREKIEDLDQLPFPAWEMFPLDRYFKIKRPHGGIPHRIPFFPINTSRGCPNDCVFCSINALWGRKFRVRSPSNILSEMQYLKDKFNCREIFFEDDNLTLDRSRSGLMFREMINQGLEFVWSSPNGIAANTIDDELLVLIKESGCRALSFGLESGDNEVLNKIIKKRVDLKHAQSIIKKAGRLGIGTAAFFVVGFPDETKEQLKHTLAFARGLDVDNVNFFFATPLPGSELFKECVRKGEIRVNFDYCFLRSGKPHFDMVDLPSEELEELISRERARFNKALFFRKPGVFLKKAYKKLINDPMYLINKMVNLC